ncbi:hypothetical protein CJ030_MR8G005839 [Morella rubra]|uniref:Uncharacterized protein n=1 Tax=Morella rubra TaxID=262757 RepID=A0A6A1UQW0_9ROSI|nr:hypothetical protein CJ030_MR8G005839 [Morella rubra]
MEAVSSSLTPTETGSKPWSHPLYDERQDGGDTTTMAHMQGAINTVTRAAEENRRAVEGMRQDLQAVLARLGGEPREATMYKPQGWRRIGGRCSSRGWRETQVSESTREEPRPRQPLDWADVWRMSMK